MTKQRRRYFILMPLLVVFLCMVAWVFIPPQLALWRLEGKVRKLLNGTLHHKGLVTETNGYLLLHPSVSGARSVQASAIRISLDKDELVLIHPVLTLDTLDAQIGSVKTPQHWSIVDGYLNWKNSVSEIGPRQMRMGSFLVNGSGNRDRSEFTLISEEDGYLWLVFDEDRLIVNIEDANLTLINDWFPSSLALHPTAGRVNGQLQLCRTVEGWRIESGTLNVMNTALEFGSSGWLWRSPASKISIAGNQLIIKAETSGQLITPLGEIAWACSDCQAYLEEGADGQLILSGQGEEVSHPSSRTFHLAAHGQRSSFLGQWTNVSLRIHDEEKQIGEIALLHKKNRWKLSATHLQAPELNILKEYFVPIHPWLADWIPTQGTVDAQVNFVDETFHLHARDLRLRHRWGRVEVAVKELDLGDSLHLTGGVIDVDQKLWSQQIEGNWAFNGSGAISGTGWSLEKKAAHKPIQLHWSGPVNQLLAWWNIESAQRADLHTKIGIVGNNLALNGNISVENQAGKPQETAQFDVVLTLGDPIPMIRGTAHADKLPLKHYLKPYYVTSGRAQMQAQFAGTTALVNFSVGRLVVSHPRIQFEADSLHGPNEIGHLDTLPAHLRIDWAEPYVRATIPVYGGHAIDLHTGLEVTGLTTTLKLDGRTFQAPRLEGYVEGLYFAGKVSGGLKNDSHIHLTLDSLQGTVHQVRTLLAKTDSQKNAISKLPLDGKISLSNDGSWIRLGLDQKEVQSSAILCGTVFDGSINVRMGEMTVQDVSARFTYQYPTQTLFIDRILGTVLVGSGENIEEYQLSGDHLRCMDSEARELEFDLWVGDKARDILRVVASTESSPTGMVFRFDRTKTHLGQIHPSILELSLKDLTQVDLFHLAFSCPLGRVWRDLKRIAHTDLLPLPRRLLREMDSLKSVEGQLVGSANYDRTEGRFEYSLEADQLKVNTHHLGKGAFVGSVQGDFWSIDQATIGDLTLSADILQEPKRWRVNFLGARLAGVLLAGLQGNYALDTGIFTGHVNLFELSLSKLRDWKVTRAMARKASIRGELKGTGTILISAPLAEVRPWHTEVALNTNLRSLSIDDIAFQDIDNLKLLLTEEGICFKEAATTIAASNVHLRWSAMKANPWRHEYAIENLQFQMPSKSIPWMFKVLNKWAPRDWSAVQTFLSGWGPNLEGSLKLLSASALTSASMQLKDGNYRIGGRTYRLQDTLIDYSPYEFGISSRIDWSGRSLWVRLISETPRLNHGRLMLSGEVPATWNNRQTAPLTLNWRRLPEGTLSVSDLRGTLWGVSVDLRPMEGRLAEAGLQFNGRIRANIDDLHNLLPEDLAKGLQLWQMKSAIEIKGDWKISPSSAEQFALDGTIYARNNQVMGYQWELAEAAIKASPSNIVLKQIKLTDQAGSGTIPELSGTRLQDGRWLVSIPKLDLLELSLNKIRRPGHQRRQGKRALSLAQVSLSSIEGTLGDRLGWRGDGSIDFTYHSPEPTAAFGKISIGSGIAYPAMGKIDFQVHSGRIHLTRLKDVYNEGKMVKFYLVDRKSPSTIGLDGSLHVTLKIKPHHMLLKVMDKMTLQVCGTLKDPVCSVH